MKMPPLLELVVCSLFLAIGLGIAAPACGRLFSEDRRHPQEQIEDLAHDWASSLNLSLEHLTCGYYPSGGLGRCTVQWTLPEGNRSVVKLRCSLEKNTCWEMSNEGK